MARTSHKRPTTALIVILLLLGAAGGWWWNSTRNSEADASLSASGEIETPEYQIAPAIAGRVTKVRVAEGDTVSTGDVLVRLDRSALKLQREQAEQGVVAARAAVDQARDDGTDADVVAAKARLAQAKAAVELAEVQLGYATVTAPRDGTIVSVITNPGQNAAPGRALLTMTAPDDLYVRVFVPETRIGDVRVGQAATVTTDSSAGEFAGTVTSVAAGAEFTPNTVQTEEERAKLVYAVRVRVSDDSGALKAGMPADVTLG